MPVAGSFESMKKNLALSNHLVTENGLPLCFLAYNTDSQIVTETFATPSNMPKVALDFSNFIPPVYIVALLSFLFQQLLVSRFDVLKWRCWINRP